MSKINRNCNGTHAPCENLKNVSKIQHAFAMLLLIKLVGLQNESSTLQIEHAYEQNKTIMFQ